MSMSDVADRVVVIGVGNPLMRDDGFGLAVLEALLAGWDVPAGVELVDGGTWGMNLLPLIEDASALILVDAINAAAPPGAEIVLEHDQLPRYLATKISPHEIDLRDVLALAELRGRLPARTVALGVQPRRVELGEGLTPLIAARVASTAKRVAERLEAWGLACPRLERACTS